MKNCLHRDIERGIGWESVQWSIAIHHLVPYIIYFNQHRNNGQLNRICSSIDSITSILTID